MLLKRFVRYYKAHMPLFILDMIVAVISSALSIFFPYLTRDLLKIQIPARNTRMIIGILTAMLIFFIIKTIANYIRTKWGHILGVRMEYDMRKDIFRHLQKLSFNYYDNVKTGHIMSRISHDLDYIAEAAHHAPEDLLISLVVIILAFIFMFIFNVQLAFIAFIPLPLMLIWGWTYGRNMKTGFKRVRKKIADINSTVENSVQGIREVKSYANEDLEIEKFNVINKKYKSSKESVFTILGVFYAVMNLLRDLYFLLIIAGGVYLIYAGRLEISDLLAFILYIGIILPPIDRLINFMEQYQAGIASFERFIEVMDIEPDIVDKKHAKSLPAVRGEIELKGINFKYNKSLYMILKDIDISIKPGETIALVGESGAGKTTLVSLIPRFYEPEHGSILFDGHDIMMLKQKFLRENIGLVQQNIFLFDTTIRENIVYGKPGVDEQTLINAAKMANIYDFIMSLPEGFDTEVGERGIKLSGGQKQRVSIARVFLKNPPVLIFDEATSSLDSESEKLIQDAMFKLSQNRTTIIIAHRLSTVKNVDRIYVLKEGMVIETGSHEELVELKGYYHSLYTKNLL